MKTSLYFLAQAGFILLPLLYYGLFLKALRSGLAKTNFIPSKRKRIFYGAVIALSGWTILISILSITGIILDFSTVPPKLFIVLIIPFVSILVITFTKTSKEILDVIPTHHIIRLQSFRMVVEILLWILFIQNLLPVQMTFEGRNFDILAGLSAPFIAYLCRAKKLHRSIALLWNVICLGLLMNIVIIAVLSMPTPFRVFMNEPSNTIVAHFPFVFLPGLLVPLAYGLHFFSLRQLMNKNK